MSTYIIWKTIHVSCALATLLGFSLRGYWMLVESPLLQSRLSRVLPHLIDTLLLASAVALVLMSRQYPFVVDWVSLKIGLLLAYIGFGTFALKRGRTLRSRRRFLLAACCTIAAIFLVALLKPSF